jgi:hypothetical protein
MEGIIMTRRKATESVKVLQKLVQQQKQLPKAFKQEKRNS